MSDTTNGLKSVLLKVVTPLWRKHNGERSVPFEISGTAFLNWSRNGSVRGAVASK